MEKKMLLFLRWLRNEYPALYKKYLLLPKRDRKIISDDVRTVRNKEDIRDVLFDIQKKYDEIMARNRKKLLGL
jgi:hypothetical protein